MTTTREFVLAGALVLVSAGCAQQAVTNESAARTVARTLPAQAVGNPTGPVILSYDAAPTVKSGEIHDVDLVVALGQGRSGTVNWKITTDPGLELIRSDVTPLVLSPGEKAQRPIRVRAEDGGLYYINVFARLDDAASQAMAIPVHVGPRAGRSAARDQQGSVTTDANGRSLQIMPVETSSDDG